MTISTPPSMKHDGKPPLVRKAPTKPMSRTRKALLEAGVRLLTDGRLDGASIDDIVREAGVAKGSFYNHFADRQTMVNDVIGSLVSQLEQAIAQAHKGITDPASLTVRGLLASFRFGMENQLGARVILHLSPNMPGPEMPTRHALMDHLKAGVEQGIFKLDRPDAAVVLVLGMADVGLARLLDLLDEFQQARSVMRDLCLTLLRALGVDARRAERIVTDALEAVIDTPRALRLASV